MKIFVLPITRYVIREAVILPDHSLLLEWSFFYSAKKGEMTFENIV